MRSLGIGYCIVGCGVFTVTENISTSSWALHRHTLLPTSSLLTRFCWSGGRILDMEIMYNNLRLACLEILGNCVSGKKWYVRLNSGYRDNDCQQRSNQVVKRPTIAPG